MITEEQYIKASRAIERIHETDPNLLTENAASIAAEKLYSRRMLSVLDLVQTNSPYSLKIAAQCQHLKRWGVPRSEYPYDRRGYHLWRRAVMEYQVELTRQVLNESEIEESEIVVILDALKDQGNKSNINATIIMDTACLVFLKWHLVPFSAKHESVKVIDILRKTMKKMSEKGLQKLNAMEFDEQVKELLNMI